MPVSNLMQYTPDFHTAFASFSHSLSLAKLTQLGFEDGIITNAS